ncbi:zinc finger protein 414-like [Onychostruthus taczanowskii]|uniref:zinc finger protein 414-like n=1 Tax=Onychostruthus taczanowskii TaxID=356909 RepID=UPI001B801901|nr:zinc finger protein 414-like [Onychostruthus taczanowskii]
MYGHRHRTGIGAVPVSGVPRHRRGAGTGKGALAPGDVTGQECAGTGAGSLWAQPRAYPCVSLVPRHCNFGQERSPRAHQPLAVSVTALSRLRCENCLLRFRTHRSLFKHLHVCSDSASGPAPAPRPALPPAAPAADKEPPRPPEALPKPPSALRPLQKESPAAGADSAPAALPGPLEPLGSGAPHPFPLLEPGLFGPSSLTRFSGPAPSSVPGPFLPYVPPSPYGLAQPPAQHRLRPFLPGHGPPSVSNAVWKKSQGVSVSPLLPCFGSGVTPGHSSNSRIVWEHTRGRYSCTQCPFSTASREDMTLHIEDHRKNPQPGRLEAEMDFGVGLAPFHTKLPPEMENSLYSQL